ncbi:DNA primase [bacterium]|nr:DNA primase [bacterium]
MDPIEEIKSKIDIVDFISEYIKLKQVGKNYQGLCPFHKDTHPSFYVSPERQFWHCFGCNESGDIFTFLEKIEGIEFKEALRILAKRAGVKLQAKDVKQSDSRLKLIRICQISALFYHQVLLKSPLAKKARDYLKKRGLKPETLKIFQIGFAPDKWDSLLKFLKKRGYSLADVEMAGLIIPGKKSGQYYDRFRNRIIFPIFNLYGEVVGFTGRILPDAEDESKAKYINTPQTLIYNKSQVLYGLAQAKQYIRDADKVILVEGNMDMISSFQAGIRNVVCLSGTALTQEQVGLIKRYTSNVLLALDVDPAGFSATNRSVELMLANDLNIKVIQLPKGKDPDECIRQNPLLWEKAVSKPILFMDYYFNQVFKGKKLNSLEEKKQVGEQVLLVVSKIKNSFERDLWIQKLSLKLKVSEDSLRQRLSQISSAEKNKTSSPFEQEDVEQTQENKERSVSIEEEIARRILGLLIKYPKITESVDFLNLDFLPGHDLKDVARLIKKYWKKKGLSLSYFNKAIKKEKRLLDICNLLVLIVEKEYENLTSEERSRELKILVANLKDLYLRSKIDEKNAQLKEAEEKKDKEKIKDLTEELLFLTKKRNENRKWLRELKIKKPAS